MKKILIIDDEKPTREFIRRMLESFKLNAAIFIDGENVETGIKAIEEIQPDLVLLDIQMPDGNGFDVLRRTQFKNFDIIFITAFQEFAIQAIKFSALDYILKPIDLEELQNSINRALDTMNQKLCFVFFVEIDRSKLLMTIWHLQKWDKRPPPALS